MSNNFGNLKVLININVHIWHRELSYFSLDYLKIELKNLENCKKFLHTNFVSRFFDLLHFRKYINKIMFEDVMFSSVIYNVLNEAGTSLH